MSSEFALEDALYNLSSGIPFITLVVLIVISTVRITIQFPLAPDKPISAKTLVGCFKITLLWLTLAVLGFYKNELDEKYPGYLGNLIFGLTSCASLYELIPVILRKLGYTRAKRDYKIPIVLVSLWMFWIKNQSYSWIFQDLLTYSIIVYLIQRLSANSSSMLQPTAYIISMFVVDIMRHFTLMLLNGMCQLEETSECASLAADEANFRWIHIPIYSLEGNQVDLNQKGQLIYVDVLFQTFFIAYLKRYEMRIENGLPMKGSNSDALPKPVSSQSHEKKRRLNYYLTALVGYTFGLAMSYALKDSDIFDLPSRIFISPFTFFPVIFLALTRGELTSLWKGWVRPTYDEYIQNSDVNSEKVAEREDKVVLSI